MKVIKEFISGIVIGIVSLLLLVFSALVAKGGNNK